MKLLILVTLLGLSSAQFSPNTRSGRTSIVHLFEWRWADIAAECERYLAPNGFGGVQISPPSESIVVTNPSYPWWQRYQPISYKLCSRSGNENELRDMITRCNNVNIYVDAVINHMCGSGGGAGTHSSCGTYFNANTKEFPGVPYSALDFNDSKCKTGSGEIENYNDVNQVRNCRLVGLLDLALEKDYVRGKVADYMNKLIDMGVAGFRVDACKHMWPGDLSAIYGRLKNLNTKWFSSGSRPFIFQEVIDLGGEPIKASEYTGLGRVTEFKYGAKLGNVVRKWNGEKLSYLKNWGEGWGMMPTGKALVFVDNHDNQRGHGAGGASILTFFPGGMLYKIATGFMLAHPYGVTRVMSSYRWNRNIVNGQVDEWRRHQAGNINSDSTCGNDWVCEHRWRQIKNMVIFRNVVNGQPLSNWWDNGNNMIAFWSMDITLNTGLPGGTYCDVISGQKEGSRCTGKQVTVGSDGRANFKISNSDQDPFIAIHASSKL
uniref:alpha-amylase n=1 Tax=Astyanax mexicanus TaxID=7994 RepID=A0A3B1IR29_ASTMX